MGGSRYAIDAQTKSLCLFYLLHVKKAFDSVDHRYIDETLIFYGFGAEFIKILENNK